MRFTEISESTTSGSVSTVSMPLGQTQSRTQVAGLQPVQKVMSGKAKKKGPYANSISESKKKVQEADLQEDDIILNPRTGRLRRSGFLPHERETEGETFKNSLHTIVRVASHLDKELSMQDEFPEWMSEKIGAVKGMMVSIMNYVISAKEMQHDLNAMEEGVKVDRMVKHVKKSEKKLGHSNKEAENIAWATANKRGMLDNKNKKK